MTRGSFWSSVVVDEGVPLTPAMFDRFVDDVNRRPPHPCKLGQHVVSSAALEPDYPVVFAPCANCGSMVRVK